MLGRECEVHGLEAAVAGRELEGRAVLEGSGRDMDVPEGRREGQSNYVAIT